MSDEGLAGLIYLVGIVAIIWITVDTLWGKRGS
jgi:hypothetical protein